MKRLRVSVAAVRRLAESGLSMGALAFGLPLDIYGLEAYVVGGLRTVRVKGEGF